MSLVCAETLVQVATKTLLPAVRKIAVMQGIVHCCIAIVSPPLEFADILMPFPNLSFSLTHTHTHTLAPAQLILVSFLSPPNLR